MLHFVRRSLLTQLLSVYLLFVVVVLLATKTRSTAIGVGNGVPSEAGLARVRHLQSIRAPSGVTPGFREP